MLFRSGFGAALLKVVGSTMMSLGAALVALGTAKLAAIHLNPFAAIGVGVALIAFGKALSNAAQAIANPASGGGGGGGAPAAGGPAASSLGGDTIVLQLQGDSVIRTIFEDHQNLDALADALRHLSGRQVRVVSA